MLRVLTRLWFSIVIMFLLLGLPDALAFSEYEFVLYANEDASGAVLFSGLFSCFNELRCVTLMWLCDPASTSWEDRKQNCVRIFPTASSQRVKLMREVKFCCFSIHFINSSFSSHWELGKLEDFPLISCLCIFASGPPSSSSCPPITHASI